MFDVVLVDYDLDDGKGDEFVRWLRPIDPNARVVAVSARDLGNEALVAAGANTVCSKTSFARIQTVLKELVAATPAASPVAHVETTTEEHANSRSPLLIYLDHSDLVDIADGRAGDVAVLRQALEVSGANLLISWVHLIDLGESTSTTKQRWVDATADLAPLRFATEPGCDVPLDRDGLATLVDEAASDVDTVRSVLAVKRDAEDASRTARLNDPKQNLSKKRLRELAEAILAGNLDQLGQLDNAMVQQVLAAVAPLRSVMKTQGLDKAEVVGALFPDVGDAVAAGDLSEVVRLRRRQDQARKPQGSDTPDEWHLKFAVHADVFTVDGNVAHVMRSISGRPLPLRRRRPAGDGERVYVYRSGQLASVARALLALSGQAP